MNAKQKKLFTTLIPATVQNSDERYTAINPGRFDGELILVSGQVYSFKELILLNDLISLELGGASIEAIRITP